MNITNIFWPDPTPGDYLPPLPEALGYMAQVGDVVVCGNRAGLVYASAMPSPFYGDTRWTLYIGNLPGQRAWSDYWDVDDIDNIVGSIKTAKTAA